VRSELWRGELCAVNCAAMDCALFISGEPGPISNLETKKQKILLKNNKKYLQISNYSRKSQKSKALSKIKKKIELMIGRFHQANQKILSLILKMYDS
jgi:hypothetical protein